MSAYSFLLVICCASRFYLFKSLYHAVSSVVVAVVAIVIVPSASQYTVRRTRSANLNRKVTG